VITGDQDLKIWLITGYEEVRAALVDPRLGQDARQAREIQDRRVGGSKVGLEIVHMLNSDPPDHTRLRGLIHAALTPGKVRAMQPLVEQIANELLDELTAHETADFIRDFALPLPLRVICELLQLPIQDRDLFRSWSTTILTDAGTERFTATTNEIIEYFEALIADRRTRPDGDLVTALIEASGRGELAQREVVSMLYLLLIAGHETTVNLLGTALLALLSNPSELDDLRADPGLLPMAVDECLRYDAPVCMATLRFTHEPLSLRGAEIPAEELVMLSLGAANRDPRRFNDADQLVLRRNDPGHLAFGYGIHRCLGSFLGHLEAEIALGGLMRRFRHIELAADEASLPWRDTLMLRGLESLPIRVRA
jgi:cytochrome P450